MPDESGNWEKRESLGEAALAADSTRWQGAAERMVPLGSLPKLFCIRRGRSCAPPAFPLADEFVDWIMAQRSASLFAVAGDGAAWMLARIPSSSSFSNLAGVIKRSKRKREP